MRATSQKIREQIIEAKLRGEKTETIIIWTKVSKSTIDKVWSRYQKTGNGASIPYSGRKSRITSDIETKIRAEIAANSDITLEEMIEKLDLPIQKSQLSKLLISWGLSFKKRRFTQKSNCARMCKKSARNGGSSRKD